MDTVSADEAVADAFVFFGATGDLAYKKIFPALHAMVRRGELNIPVIGMARAGWTLEKLRQRARESIEHNGDFDPDAFARLYRSRTPLDPDTAKEISANLAAIDKSQ